MSRAVQRWAMRGGKLVKLGSPPRQPKTQTVTKTGVLTLNPTVFVGGTPVLPAPFPTFTDYPLIPWQQLDTQYAQRNLNKWAELPDVDLILNSMGFRAYVELPEGFRGKGVDFNRFNYSIYAPKCMGLWGHGADRAVIRIEPYSSTKASLVPLQPPPNTVANNDGGSNPYTLMRLGPMNGSTTGATHNYGFALFGTNQPNQPNNPQRSDQLAHPHNYSGLQSYMGSGSTDVCLVIGGVQADWQSPPGETGPYAQLATRAQCFLDYSEITGFNEGAVASGAPPTDYVGASTMESDRVGGGVLNNNAVNPTYRWNYIHDSFVSSGPIVSGSGGPAGKLCQGGTIIGNKIHRNANHFPTSTAGKQFGCFNDEGCMPGPNNIPLRVEDNDLVFTSNQAVLNQRHAFFGNWAPNPDHPDIRFLRNRWQGPQFNSPSGTWIPSTVGPYGAPLYASMIRNYSGQPNTQVTFPVVTHPDTNVVLQPVIRDTAKGEGIPKNVDARYQYILEL